MQERCDEDVVSAVQVYEFAIKPIKALLDSFPAILDNARSEVLFRRVEDDFLLQTQGDELAMALGDCWTGAILVSMDEHDPAVGSDRRGDLRVLAMTSMEMSVSSWGT